MLSQTAILKDDVAEIMAKVKESEVVVFATPIYYYEMCGQMKTLLDRLNPLYESDYKFRDIYMLATAADDDLRLNEIPFSAVLGAATTRLILHTGFPLVQILGLIAYMAAGYILTVLLLRKRKLEF